MLDRMRCAGLDDEDEALCLSEKPQKYTGASPGYIHAYILCMRQGKTTRVVGSLFSLEEERGLSLLVKIQWDPLNTQEEEKEY